MLWRTQRVVRRASGWFWRRIVAVNAYSLSTRGAFSWASQVSSAFLLRGRRWADRARMRAIN